MDVDEVRALGYKVYFHHFRWPEGSDLPTDHESRPRLKKHELKDQGLVASPRGGFTQAYVVNPHSEDDSIISYGHARCSTLDNFNKKIAREIAFGRAMKGVTLEPLEKTQ